MADQVKWRTVLIGIGVVGVLGIGGVSIANAAGAFVRPEPAPTVVAEVVQVRDVAAEPEHPTPTPTPTVEPVVEAPPAEEAPVEEPPAEPVYGQYPAGYPVPWIASSDPNNASGGEWDTTACASGRAYWEGDASFCG